MRLPENPFGGQAPNLRNVAIYGFHNFFWDSCKYDHPTCDRLLSSLESMSQLETLHLGFCLPNQPLSVAARTVRIPSLKALVLQDTPIACLNVFAGIHVPNAYLTLLLSAISNGEAPQPDVNDRLAVLLEEHFSRAHPSKQAIDVLELSTPLGTDGTILFLAGPDPRPGDRDVKASHGTEFLWEGGEPSLSLPLHVCIPDFLGGYDDASALLIARFCSTTPLHAVRTLELKLPYGARSPGSWLEIAQSLPNMEELSVTKDLPMSFLKDCRGRALRVWRNLNSVRLGPLDFCCAPRITATDFQEIMLKWLIERRDLSPPPLTITIRRTPFDRGNNLDGPTDASYSIRSDAVDADAASFAKQNWLKSIGRANEYARVEICWVTCQKCAVRVQSDMAVFSR
ncbi:hypothetical protein BC834DRAFT_867807 [Gloeopeniophorella convolvens]|nr:hypothetical protein BC834DRAFT_867807 [Gloeopeniophorella convolvens]